MMTTKTARTGKAATITGRVDERKGRLLTEVNSDVTSTQVPDLRRDLLDILENKGYDSWKHLYLDIRSARMVDSMGINWLFAETMRLKERNKVMVIRISSPAINRVIQFAGLDKIAVVKFRRRKQTR